MANLKISALILCSILICSRAVLSSASSYVVGDSSGWALGVDYSSWGHDKTFKVGDNLSFVYEKNRHTVEEVSSVDFTACRSSNPISSDDSGITTVALKISGNHYFISGVAGDCSNGMKLVVRVETSTSTAY